jgi:fructose-bisphosphate aldolase, class II
MLPEANWTPAHGEWTKKNTSRPPSWGVTKINIDTDGRLVWTRVHREFFRDHPEQFDFRPPGKTFVAEYAEFIAHKNEKLGSAGQLPEVRQALAKKYS